MPHDAHGNEVKVGDRVTMEFEVIDLNEAVERCNVTLVACEPEGLGEYRPAVNCNARLTTKVSP